MTGSTPRRTVLAASTAAVLLLIATPTPAAALRTVTAGSAADPTAPLVALLGLAAWALTGWLLLAVALTAGARVPGRVGAAAGALVRRVAPASLRRVIELSLGLTVALGGIGAAPAAASPGPPAAPPAAAPSLDWAAAAAPEPAPPLDWGATAPAAPVPHSVLVSSGDSLWELAAADLSARTGATPSDAQVAAAWPAWWAANREAVGEDPHLIRPGTRLTPPADGASSS